MSKCVSEWEYEQLFFFYFSSFWPVATPCGGEVWHPSGGNQVVVKKIIVVFELWFSIKLFVNLCPDQELRRKKRIFWAIYLGKSKLPGSWLSRIAVQECDIEFKTLASGEKMQHKFKYV